MRPTDPMRPPTPPNWRRRLVITLVIGTSTLYCLGIGAYAAKRMVVPGGQAPVPVAMGATQTPATPFRTATLEPTPTEVPLVFPTVAPATAQPEEAAPTLWEAPDTWPTAVPTEPATPTPSPTPETPTPTLEPTATETPLPTETPSPTPDHGGGKPTETPSPTPE